MPDTSKSFFGFLVWVMMLSVVLSYGGIAREKRENEWQNRYDVNDPEYKDSGFTWLTNRTIVFLDSTAGKIVSWTSIIIIPLACGILAFGYERLYLGLFSLLFCTAFYSWIAVKLYLFDRFLPIIRM